MKITKSQLTKMVRGAIRNALNEHNMMHEHESRTVDTFTRQYMETALWSSTDDDGEPLDRNYSIDDLTQSAKDKMISDSEKFQNMAGDVITKEDREGEAGHDFWLSRNGHGAGFWDGDWEAPYKGEDEGEFLTELSDKFGEQNLYVTDDGKIDIY